uniref:Gag-like protein n=1 Tax=Bombyx mori TaxID=7091 RepID=A0A8R2MAJ0_BOMMO|nr:uncharacterized protein LOC101741146 [Bombyx mori]
MSEEERELFSPRVSLARSPPRGPTAPLPAPMPPPAPRGVRAGAAMSAKGRRTGLHIPVASGLSSSAPVTPVDPVAGVPSFPIPVASGAPTGPLDVAAQGRLELLERANRAVRGIMSVATAASKLNKSEVNLISELGRDILAVVGALGIQLSDKELVVERLRSAEASARRDSVAPSMAAGAAAGSGTGPATFATVLRTGPGGVPRSIGASQGPSLAFYPSEGNAELKTAEDTKKEVKKAIDPKSMAIGIQSVRKVGNAGVVVQTTSPAAAVKLRNAAPPSLRVTEPRRRQPLVAVNGVEGDPSFEEVIECLASQNLDPEEWPLTRVRAELTGAFKKGRRQSNNTTVVFNASPRIRDALVKIGRVYVGWVACEVTDFVRVTCCNKCQQYGHPEKFCRAKEATCGRCGEDGHRMEACKAASACCATCRRFRREAMHPTASRDCPARRHAEERFLNQVEYGY